VPKKLKIDKHILIPKHTKIGDKEKKELFEKYKISINELPKINKSYPVIKHLNLKGGDVVKITRNEPTSGETSYYRGVINV
jgi:DNA-directed RNA polymerase subunit H (RpoH/RPB5)